MYSVVEKYKGKWVRLYTHKDDYVEGVLLGSWNHYYVTLQSDVGRHAKMTFLDQDTIKMIIPIHLLDEKGKICKLVYANVN